MGLVPIAQNLMLPFLRNNRHTVHRACQPCRAAIPTLSSHGIQAPPGARTSAETRVLGANPILLSSRFLRHGRLSGNDRSVQVQVMSVYGKESKPCIILCSYKVHLAMARSNGSVLISIGIPTLYP